MFLQVYLLFVLSEVGGQFSYKNPANWANNYPTCNGKAQSPIDLPVHPHDNVLLSDSILQWRKYNNRPSSMTAVNNGHTIQISGTWRDKSRRPYIKGGPLKSHYVFEQFHFHWGNNESVGSEHTFNGKRSALELHIVHYKREYGSFNAAVNKADGLAIVAALYDPSFGLQTHGIKRVWKGLKSLRKNGSRIRLKPFPLSDFEVVRFGDTFVSYHGSLTTPGCNEVATWLVALDLFSITESELRKIRRVHLLHGDRDNWRPLQDRNGRALSYYKSFV